ncbi:type II toxin-antitoxin system VapC family toxin [uncultured Spirosoma sp.]|uniref:type II toxin-antitoxin system VapC family toxin n=1 Tax=uncultured Spirosoma sp. TaxID=278208 RepID=UPI00258D0194|nr:type II toxin-antitoxin system VapC family toxin [uncultured Spirosoma sp.]
MPFFAENSINTVLISSITVIEFRSIVWRKVRMKEVSSAGAQEIIRVFTHDLSLYSIINFDDSLLQLASQLIDKHGLNGLRSLDALQLASAVIVRDQVTLYKTADRLLNDLFKAEGLPV